jgi:hypothetical protein
MRWWRAQVTALGLDGVEHHPTYGLVRVALTVGLRWQADSIGGGTYGRCCWCWERACCP